MALEENSNMVMPVSPMFGGGGGFGGGGAMMNGALTRAELYDGFAIQNIDSAVRGKFHPKLFRYKTNDLVGVSIILRQAIPCKIRKYTIPFSNAAPRRYVLRNIAEYVKRRFLIDFT